MKPLLCPRHHRQVKQAAKPRSFVHINIKNNQNMIKKLWASYQEIEAIAG